MTDFCTDCPDREACWLGMSCDFSKAVEQYAKNFDQVLKGKTIMSNNTAKKPATITEVAEQAVEEKLVVPAQAEGEKIVEPTNIKKSGEAEDAQSDNVVDSKVMEGEKIQTTIFKIKTARLINKVKRNKKALLATVAVVGVIVTVAVKNAKKQVEEILDESALTEDEQKSIQDDLDANESGA